jgi:hypothetical protein
VPWLFDGCFKSGGLQFISLFDQPEVSQVT